MKKKSFSFVRLYPLYCSAIRWYTCLSSVVLFSVAGLTPGYAADLSALDTLFGKPNLIVPEATAPPEIDGSLSDPAWQKAPRAFMVRNDARGKPKQDTWLKVVSDDDHLYVAVHCAENRMERLRANVKETDGPLWSDDSLEMFIDPGHKEDFSYYQFIFNAIGTAHHTKAGDKSWTPRSLKIANRKLAQAWTLELKIAFADLVGEAPLPKLWGFNLMRVRYPKMGTEIPKGEKAIEFLRNMNFEESAWSPTLTTTSHVPFRFGQLYLKGGEVEPNILKRLAMKKSLKPDGAFPVTAKNLNRIYGGPSVLIPQVNRAPDIDGKLNDTAWRKAEPLSFSTNSGGKSAVHRTIARTVTDPESIYFAFQCFDREVEFLVADETREDGDYWNEDSIEIFLDVGHTHKVDYYHFGINAVGAIWLSFLLPPLTAAPIIRVNLTELNISGEDPRWTSSEGTSSHDLKDDFDEVEDELEAADNDELVATPDEFKEKAGKTKQQLEARATRVPPTMIYREPTEAERKKKDPRHMQAIAGKFSPITIPKFWNGNTPTPRRKLFLEIRYKDAAPKMAEVYVYNGRTFMGNRRGHHDGYRRIGAISGIDDGRWKTAILETSPFDFRYEKKWNGTQILIRSLGTEKSKGQQEPRNLPIEFVAIHEPTQQLEIESRKQWRGVVHIQADVDRRERSELRWEDQKKHQSDELAHVPDEPPPYPPKFGAAGFITFQVGLYSHVAPLPDQKGLNGRHYSAPKKDHLRESIETFLSLGEYESIPFAIYPLKNLRNVRYDLGMLKKEDGTVFRGWVKPGYVEYSQYVFVPRTETEREPRGLWRSIPLRIWELSQHDRFDLRKGVPFRFWLTVRADEDCEPGSYSTTIRITTSDSAFELPLKVEVLPFRLPSTTELGKVAGYTISPSISEFEYWNLREHNFNTVHEFWNAGINVWLTPNEIDINYGRIDEKMRFARRMDFRYFIIEMANVRKILRGGYPDSLHADQFGDWVELYSRGCFMMREHAKTSGWPELGFCPSDEPWGFYMWHLNEVVRRWMKKYDPATPVYANMYGGHHTHVMKNFDIINTNATGSDPFMAYECQQYGIDLWIYGSHREQFYPWAFDAGGIIKYRYNTSHALFYRGASDGEPELYFHRGEPVPRIGYERRRDGLDGCRYAWYLQRLLKDSPNPQIERLLEDLKYSIKANAFNRPGWRERDPNPGTLDLGRQKLMAKCQRLLKSWKSKDEQAKDGLTIAGRMASRENEIHKRNMGKPKGDLSYNAVRRQLVDWILIPNPGQGHD